LAGVPADMNGSKFLQEELLWPQPSHLNPGVAAPQIAAHLIKSAQNTAHKSPILLEKMSSSHYLDCFLLISFTTKLH
jgi:hypothetical protein